MEATKAWQQAAFSSAVVTSSRTCTDYHRKMQRHPSRWNENKPEVKRELTARVAVQGCMQYGGLDHSKSCRNSAATSDTGRLVICRINAIRSLESNTVKIEELNTSVRKDSVLA